MRIDSTVSSSQSSVSEQSIFLQLTRQAIHAESSEALQFLLVNRTHSLKPYTLGILWAENEGVITQSGVSTVDRNAPFMQWLNSICETLNKKQKVLKVTSDLFNTRELDQWGEFLPASAIWFPIVLSNKRTAGLLLCRSDSWSESDLLVLRDWVELWSQIWAKMQRPSTYGELTLLWKKLSDTLPNAQEISSEVSAFKTGVLHALRITVNQPSIIPKKLFQVCRDGILFFSKAGKHIKRQGLATSLGQLKTELKSIWLNPRRRWKWIAIIVILFPTRLTVLAPAELVPANPAVIRSPIEGVVDEIFVKPNQLVIEGQPLFKLDLTTLTSRLNVAEQETQIAASEYRQSTLQSLSDTKSRAQLIPQESKTAQRKVEADYLKELVAKAQIKSPRSGVVLFDDPSEWIGKPVVAGEKVMVVTTEGDVEIEAWVSVGDAITMPKSVPVILYLNATPLNPVDGTMRYIGHEALARPDGTYAYRLRAKLNPGEDGVRVGLKGTAKISGQFVPFGYLILRKPIGALRQFLGI